MLKGEKKGNDKQETTHTYLEYLYQEVVLTIITGHCAWFVQ